MTEIIEMEEAPAAIKELILSETEGITTIEKVIFGAFMADTTNITGCYWPKNKTIVVDMGNVMTMMILYNKGMMYIPNVWYSLIHTIGHEIYHAMQFETIPELMEYEKLPQEYEDEADIYGTEMMEKWAMAHNRIPELSEMGWLGKQLVMRLNEAYTKAPDMLDELDYMRVGAAASLDAVLATEDDEELKTRTIKDVDTGTIGLKVDGKRFLTAHEFIGTL